jgi:hypothetical protein
MSIRAIAKHLGLQPSSVHVLLRRRVELPRDRRRRLVPSIVHKLAHVKVRGKKKRVSARAVLNVLPPASCCINTVRAVMKITDTSRRRKRLKNAPLSQSELRMLDASRQHQGW